MGTIEGSVSMSLQFDVQAQKNIIMKMIHKNLSTHGCNRYIYACYLIMQQMIIQFIIHRIIAKTNEA